MCVSRLLQLVANKERGNFHAMKFCEFVRSVGSYPARIPLLSGNEILLTVDFGVTVTVIEGFDMNVGNSDNKMLPVALAVALGIGVFSGQLMATEIIDTDKDLLSDQEEERLGTDPKDPDTDKDGLPDGEEVITF